MNPDAPTPREQLEARLTALLLGELPADEAAALRAEIGRDAELAALHRRLEHTIELVRETAADPVEQMAEQPAPLRLSEERREKLLAQFKTVAPKEFARKQPRYREWLVPAAAVAALVVLAAIMGVFKNRNNAHQSDAKLLLPSMTTASRPVANAVFTNASILSEAGDAAWDPTTKKNQEYAVAHSGRAVSNVFSVGVVGYVDLTANSNTPAIHDGVAVAGTATPASPVRNNIVLPSATELAGVDNGSDGLLLHRYDQANKQTQGGVFVSENSWVNGGACRCRRSWPARCERRRFGQLRGHQYYLERVPYN